MGGDHKSKSGLVLDIKPNRLLGLRKDLEVWK